MQWLVSGPEPESLYAPILTEERLRAGAVRELVKLRPGTRGHFRWSRPSRST